MIRIEQILSIGWQKIRGDNSNGGGKGIRTLDPSVANAVLSQLSYAPTEAFSDQLSAVSKKDRLILDFRIVEDRPFVKHLSLCTLLQFKLPNLESSEADALVKSLLDCHPGESRGPEHLEILDSGFRRNDEFYGISTFYESIKAIDRMRLISSWYRPEFEFPRRRLRSGSLLPGSGFFPPGRG